MKFATVIALSWYVEYRSAIYNPRNHCHAILDRVYICIIVNVGARQWKKNKGIIYSMIIAYSVGYGEP